MPTGSLIPDRQLTFSKGLAETIGLEEAILLQELGSRLKEEPHWTAISTADIQHVLSFWSAGHIENICNNLVALGILAQTTSNVASSMMLAVAKAGSAAPGNIASTSTRSLARNPVRSAQWQPNEDLIEFLFLNHSIPRTFTTRVLRQFAPDNSGRNSEMQFRQFVLSRWRDEESRNPAFEIATPPPFGRNWHPTQDALDILEQAGIDASFADSIRSEFILYWTERGGPPKEVNSRFIEHARRRWLRHTSQLSHSTAPSRMPPNWRPDPAVYETLQLAGISESAAQELLPEFVMYWVDSNEVQTSWNSKFLQHVKRQCLKNGYGAQNGEATEGGKASAGHRTKDRSLSDDLTDTTWAN